MRQIDIIRKEMTQTFYHAMLAKIGESSEEIGR